MPSVIRQLLQCDLSKYVKKSQQKLMEALTVNTNFRKIYDSVQNPPQTKQFFIRFRLKIIHSVSGFQSASFLMYTEGSFPGGTAATARS
jgi:hypothetical protein